MSESTKTTTRISEVATVFVAVGDQDRSLEFYVEKLGFEKRLDFSYGDGSRWVEVAPPGATQAIALLPPGEGEGAGAVVHCALTTDDIEGDHASLLAGGVDVDAEIAREGTGRPGLVSAEVTIPDPVPPQVLFRDPDGNRFLIVDPSGFGGRLQVVNDVYDAYVSGDRSVVERHLSEDFIFSAPPDVGIDRATYFERCWPGSQTSKAFEYERLFEANDEVIVTYEATRTDGTRFRNTEIFGFEGDQISRVEVYFGWDLD